MSFTLPTLPYNYDALEPYFDKETMEIHYTKHHQTYINNTNNVLSNLTEAAKLSVDILIQKIDCFPTEKQTAIRNNAGGHANHSLFWKILKQDTELKGELKKAIDVNFGNIYTFKKKFEETAISCFGSGWAWLVKRNGKLAITSTANQDNPLMGEKISGTHGYPIFGLDVWEHAYYLKYKNRRQDYIQSFWSVINWDEAEKRFMHNV